MNVHSRTPTLSAHDPRGLPVRTVDYWRTEAVEPAQTRINRTLHDVAGRAVAQWDPRLWSLHMSDPQTGEYDLGVFAERPGAALGQR